MNYTIQELRDKGLILLEAIMGSRAYGTSLSTSDTDIRGIFIQPLEDILKYGYVEQVSEKNNDVVFYELKRFMDLVKSNNPNILELLNAPEDCIIYQNPLYLKIKENRKRFVSKKCKETFGGYAVQQIKKARGYNKKINWEESEMTRKTVLDFCYVVESGKSFELKPWMKKTGTKQEEFALAKIDHARDLYAMYYVPKIKMRKGIISERKNVNDVQIVSVPKGIEPIRNMIFNKDAYSTHCKRYSEYKEWLDNRNEDRFKMNKKHGKNYDSKNMMHVFRLLNTSLRIAIDGEIIVRRPAEEIEILMKIRRGEYDYDIILNQAEKLLELNDKTFESSKLSEIPNFEFINNLQYEIRKKFYEDR